MRFTSSLSRRNWIVGAIVVPPLLLLLLPSGVLQWSPLNCWHDEVDITTGRVRHTR